MMVLACFLGLTIIIRATMAAVDDCQDMKYWNGTHCVQCSGCPRGFGVRTKCTSKQDTDCQPCWPDYDYSNTTGYERCILCDKYSNCLPGNSKKIRNCTIFSGPVCDGCEDGYYREPLVGPNGGCVECSPKCSILQVEIRSCSTDHDRECKAKGPVTFPNLRDSPTGSDKIPSSTAHQGPNVEPEEPAGTSHPSSIPLAKDSRLWSGIGGGSIILFIAMVAVIIRKKLKNRRKLDAKQRQPLMSSVKPGLDGPISGLTIEGRRFITQKLNGKYHDGYFYWQMCADKLGLLAECESWKHAENPAEKFLTAFGEKAGSTIRKLVEALRDQEVDLTQIANEIEAKFSPPKDQDEQDVNETWV